MSGDYSERDDWDLAVSLFKKGDPSYLAAKIRKPSLGKDWWVRQAELNGEQRAWLADLIEGKIKFPRRRGARLKLNYGDRKYIAGIWEMNKRLNRRGHMKDVLFWLAKNYSVNQSTIKNIVSPRQKAAK